MGKCPVLTFEHGVNSIIPVFSVSQSLKSFTEFLSKLSEQPILSTASSTVEQSENINRFLLSSVGKYVKKYGGSLVKWPNRICWILFAAYMPIGRATDEEGPSRRTQVAFHLNLHKYIQAKWHNLGKYGIDTRGFQ